ncbi:MULTISPECIES: hypothetical protein [Pantoea]|mgnify:CR=1 FL=1|jgi:hypothetical protein|uniref:hypothetical protein n=1 Tax=Pantoea TaxID=53335 RepID=UPI00091D0524|nr:MULTISPECIES: hypothetical protein [Pantoea]MDJ0034042.1 hypothetical protein [Pantoea ananatis]MDJ0043094.1 hypothetical protein [Pantoea ananatis]MDQ1228552.1 hypothetical protein [Pantoea ananatis]MDR6092217.1 hypothetical protein [Pantoea ananatis]SFY17164.1 hypothetical protein SAMN03097714_0072 [Pantoea ananatis]
MNIKACRSRLMFKSRWVNNPSVASKRIEDEFIRGYFQSMIFISRACLVKGLVLEII